MSVFAILFKSLFCLTPNLDSEPIHASIDKSDFEVST